MDDTAVIDAQVYTVRDLPAPRRPRGPACVDLEAERAVLAALLLEGDDDRRTAWVAASAMLSADDFHDPRHAAIWRGLAALYEGRRDVDVVTLCAQLRAMERFNTVGGAQEIGDLTDNVVTTAHIVAHARIVATLAASRRLGQLLADTARKIAGGGGDLATIHATLLEQVRAVRIPGPTVAPLLGAEVMAWSQEIERRSDGTEAPLLSTGLTDLDHAFGGGLGPGMVMVAARPRVGKTAMVLQMGLEAAEALGRPVYVLSLEMSRRQLLRAAIACRGRVNLSHIQSPRDLAASEWAPMYAAANALDDGLPIYAHDDQTPGCPRTVPELAATIAALPSLPALVVVDHVGKLAAVGKHRERREALREIGDALHRLGMALGIPILTLVHIGRGMAKEGLYRRPRLEDIVESATLEADADAVVILHREDLYPTKKYTASEPAEPGLTHALVSKVRWGEPGRVAMLRFNGAHQRFASVHRADASPLDVGRVSTIHERSDGEGLPDCDGPAYAPPTPLLERLARAGDDDLDGPQWSDGAA